MGAVALLDMVPNNDAGEMGVDATAGADCGGASGADASSGTDEGGADAGGAGAGANARASANVNEDEDAGADVETVGMGIVVCTGVNAVGDSFSRELAMLDVDTAESVEPRLLLCCANTTGEAVAPAVAVRCIDVGYGPGRLNLRARFPAVGST